MDLLEKGLEQLGLTTPETAGEKLRLYIGELELWNRRINLVRAEGEELIIRHIFDSLIGVEVLRPLSGTDVSDIGSGAGLPGIPLSMWLPEKEFTLIERSQRRCGFLRNALARCGLPNVRVVQSPLEEVKEEFSICIFRALGSLPRMYPAINKLIRPGGICMAYKGKREVAYRELETMRRDSFTSEIIPVAVPYLEEDRNILLLRKK